MAKYGNDRPDIRFGQTLFDMSGLVAESGFSVFKNAVAGGGQVKGVVYPGGAAMSRREIDELTEFIKPYGAKGVAWIGVTGPAGADGLYPADSCAARSPSSSPTPRSPPSFRPAVPRWGT